MRLAEVIIGVGVPEQVPFKDGPIIEAMRDY